MMMDRLHKIDIFETLSQKELEGLYSFMEHYHIPDGTILFREGDPGETMFVVLSGAISISISVGDSNEEMEISRIGEESFFGEMSIFEKGVRSATCRAVGSCTLLSLSGEGLQTLMEKEPNTAIKIMVRMLKTATNRLSHTNAFLSEMVTWGEEARIRAVSDDFTGLYNRRFFDKALEDAVSNAMISGSETSLVILDFDHFGSLNKEYGEEVGDAVLLAAVSIFRKNFDKESILVRYGGDEFSFILQMSGKEALKKCQCIVEEIRKIDVLDNLGGSFSHVSISLGIAVCPTHGKNSQELLSLADKALYMAKESGRDQAVLFKKRQTTTKSEIRTPWEKNRIMNNIIDVICKRKNFLLVGHQCPDEDCVASMATFGLLLAKFSKQSTMLISKEFQDHFPDIINACSFDSINVLDNLKSHQDSFDTIVIFDTPKPHLLEFKDDVLRIINQENVTAIEFDHHLGTDSEYIGGDKNYSLVDSVSSTCELMGTLILHLSRKKQLLRKHHAEELWTRNLLLTIVIGILSDTQMGKIFKTSQEKHHFLYYQDQLKKSLLVKTGDRFDKFSSLEDVMEEFKKLSHEEESCFKHFYKNKQTKGLLSWVALDEQKTQELIQMYSSNLVVSVAKNIADTLAEESGGFSLIAYYGSEQEKSNLVQFRMRRNHNYKKLDLRKVIEKFDIKNGGGHEGAIGFRIPKYEIEKFDSFIETLVLGILNLVSDTPKKPHKNMP